MVKSTQIKNKRKELGLTVKEFADAIGLGRSGDKVLRAWENGESVPSENELLKILKFASERPYFCNQGNRFTYIDLFAGIGGIRIPFQELGGKCVFSS